MVKRIRRPAMQKYIGKGVYGAIAIGRIAVFKREDLSVEKVCCEDTDAEIKRFENAKNIAIEQLKELYEKASKEVGEVNAQIFEVHMMMLNDSKYNEFIYNIINTKKVNAEYAVTEASDYFSETFLETDDVNLQVRSVDIKDISNRIIANLIGINTEKKHFDDKVIICADDLTPSETVSLEKDKVVAIVTAHGSINSHTTILAKNMNIPTIIGIGNCLINELRDGQTAIVDGYTGEFYLDPNEQTIENYVLKQKKDEDNRKHLKNMSGRENVTIDGTKINIYANIDGIDNINAVLENDAGGIGLFRTEFLYLENSDFPTEEQQLVVYRKVLESMSGKKVIIRTLDIGSDKQADYIGLNEEENPALGLRAIRFSLTHREIFKTQLRALYRASVFGKLGIMFPMISSEGEVIKALEICDEVKNELKNEGIKYSDNVEIGIMIETPAAAILSDRLARYVDFFSVGTNDLIQYTLACDRQNPNVEKFIDTHYEAILRLIKMSAENAHKNGILIGICGELAADTRFTETFLKMGIDELSVAPSFVLKVREVVRKVDLVDIRRTYD